MNANETPPGSLTVRVPGNPIAQPRVKAQIVGEFAHIYTPTKNGIADYKAAIRMVAADEYRGELLHGPIRVDCTFVFARPKHHFGTGKNADRLKPNAPFWHVTKPDRDNLDKAVLDALKGIVAADDCQVCCGEIVKHYAEAGQRPETVIRIRTVSAGF